MIFKKLNQLYSTLFDSKRLESDEGIKYLSYFDSVLNNQIHSIILFDADFKILAFNKKIEADVISIRNIQLRIGDNVLSLIADNNKVQFHKDVKSALSGQSILSERMYLIKMVKNILFFINIIRLKSTRELLV